MLWLTNLAAPYRLPVWDALSEIDRLEILTLADNEWNRSWDGMSRSRDYISGLRTFAWRRGESTHYWVRRGLFGRLRRHESVVLGGWDSPAYWQAMVIAKALRMRTVGFYESTPESQGFTDGPVASARTKFFSSLDAVVVPGSRAADAVREMGVAEQAIFVGRNCVDHVSIHSASLATPVSMTDRHRFPHKYIYVGQLIERKNVRAIISAMASQTDSTLDIIGSGDQLPQLIELVQALSLESRVVFHGALSYAETLQAMARCDTLILASTTEVWGMVVNEALASGCNVVVSGDCGVARDVRDMPGVYVTTTDIDSIAAGMRSSRLGWRGRRRCPEILEWSPERFAKVFHEASRGRRASAS
jgi:glycosyltransferase involved in cell wall biosynthesis